MTRYRVWCLSWEEDDEHGADVVHYDILSHDTALRERGVVYMPDTVFRGAVSAAEAYADYVHSQRDGYECSWPLIFRVRSPDGSISDFEVEREYAIEFTARPVTPAKLQRSKECADAQG